MKKKKEAQVTGKKKAPSGSPQFPLSSMGTDSTSVSEIQVIMTEDKGQLLGDPGHYQEVDDYLAKVPDYQNLTKEEREERIKKGLDLLEKSCTLYHRSRNAYEGTFTVYAFRIGQQGNFLKPLVKAQGEDWEPWAAKNIPWLSESTRQNYMRLAEFPEVLDFAYLGMERIFHILAHVKRQSRTPIRDFLRENKLSFDPSKETNLGEFNPDYE